MIALKDVAFDYGPRRVLEHVTLNIEDRQLVSIIGPNGGGKTTLLKLILGLLQPSQGEILLLGQPPRNTRRLAGYVPQHILYDPQFPVTAMDVVLMGRLGLTWGGRHGREDKRAAMAALEEMRAGDWAQRRFSQLSGGQRQRILIARALAGDPKILLLDEPTSNVDTEGESQLFQILQTLNQRMTILLVSHDLSFVANIVQKVICVNRRVAVHTPSEMSTEAIQDIYHSDLRLVRHTLQCFDTEPHEHA